MTENGWDEHFADDRSRLGQKITRSGLKNVSPSQSNNCLRQSILRVSENMRAKKVRFYRNGDRFFKGMLYAVSPERFRTFESLLAELTMSPLCDKNVLPQGVRYIFSAETAKIITTLDQLEEGESYVCASNDMFRDINYEKSSNPNWNVNVKTRENQELTGNSGRDLTDDDKSFIKPKLVTIIRNGTKPRKAVRILLNKKTVHSFSQVLDDITDAIKLDSGTVKKIYTVDGRQVTCLSDFFQDETIFIAYGAEKCSMDDFDLDQKEVRLVSGYKTSLSQSRERITLRSPKSPRKSSSSRSLHEVGLESPSRSRNSSPKSPRKLRTVSAPKYRNGVTNGSTSLPNSPKPARRSTAGKTRLPDELTERYDIGMVIGEGNFAVVKECVDRFNNRRFALKIIDKSRCKGKEEEMLENEVSILRKVKHPNIILLVEEYDTRDSLFMVMELVKGGDLFDAIAASTKYTERDASGMVYNLVCALKYLHSLNIVHRDIKPENLLVCDHGDDSKSLKLGDFGLATVVSDTLYTVCGTPTYVAPEVLAESGYGLKIDVWSTGVITYILLCGFPPFYSAKDNQEELFDHILEGKFGFTEPFWNDVSESAKELISNMLVVDPDDRFTAEQVLQHPWVASDTARDEDIHDNITEKLNSHFDHKAKRKPKDSAGIRLITSTALDKGSRYFQGRGGATFTLHARGNNSDSEDEDEIF